MRAVSKLRWFRRLSRWARVAVAAVLFVAPPVIVVAVWGEPECWFFVAGAVAFTTVDTLLDRWFLWHGRWHDRMAFRLMCDTRDELRSAAGVLAPEMTRKR